MPGIWNAMATSGVSDSQLGRALGNSIPTCVLERVLRQVFLWAGYISELPADNWKQCVESIETDGVPDSVYQRLQGRLSNGKGEK